MGRIPEWLRASQPSPDAVSAVQRVKEVVKKYGLNTLHSELLYPLTREYYGQGVPTFLIMGNMCTRSCKFCYLSCGKPAQLEQDEPKRLANAVAELGLGHVVITSVERDDLYDSGASHFADCITAVKTKNTGVVVEAVVPDFQGKLYSIKKLLSAQPDVVCHNIETVRKLHREVRDAPSSYDQSLNVLKKVKGLAPSIKTKSALFLGFGEKETEVIETMNDLRRAGVDFIVLGQYVQPSALHIKTKKFIESAVFEELKQKALELGFSQVEASPAGRNPYHSHTVMKPVVTITATAAK